MRKFLILFILLLLLPLGFAKVTISCDSSFNPLKEPLSITVKSDTDLHNVDLRVFDQAGDELQTLVLKDSRNRVVDSLRKNKQYNSKWTGLDSSNVPFSDQWYFFKLVRNNSELLSGVGQTMLDQQLNEPEYTRNELKSWFPAETWEFTLFSDKPSIEKKFVLVLDEDDPLFESQDIELTGFEVEGVDESFISVNWNKPYKFYPNRAEKAKRERLAELIVIGAELRELKKNRDLLAKAALAVKTVVFKRADTIHYSSLYLIGRLKAWNNFRSEKTFFKRSEPVFLDYILDDDKIALIGLIMEGAVYVGEPYIVIVKAELPESEFDKAPFTLKGKIKFKHSMTKETVREFEIQVSELTAEEKFKQSCSSCPDMVIQEAIKQSLSIKEVEELETALDSIKKFAGTDAVSTFSALRHLPKIAYLFVNNPNEFVEISRAATWRTSHAFRAIGEAGQRVVDLFMEYPEEFVEMAKAAGEDTSAVFIVFKNNSIANLFKKDPRTVTNSLIDIIKASRGRAFLTFDTLGKSRIARLFVRNPDAFVEMAKAAGSNTNKAFGIFENYELADLFVKNPNVFVRMTKVTGRNSYNELVNGLKNEKMADLFVKNPQQVTNAFDEMTKATGEYSSEAFVFLRHNEMFFDLFVTKPHIIVKLFLDIKNAAGGYLECAVTENYSKYWTTDSLIKYSKEEISSNELIIYLYSGDCSIEFGRALDYLHDNTRERMAYLNRLPDLKVVGLLLSNPAFFYTSSNHLLFDRLKSDLTNQRKSVSDLFNELNVSDDLRRNFIFRAINYDRFFGTSNSLFTEPELNPNINLLMDPISSNKFNETYYFLLANALDKFSDIGNMQLKYSLLTRLRNRLSSLKASNPSDIDRKQIVSALEFLVFNINENTLLVSLHNKNTIRGLRKKSFFYPSKYFVAGKLQVLQVFDKADTEIQHWGLTQNWFKSEMGEPIQGANEELIYEDAFARVILFMGEDEEYNRKFITNELTNHPNQIITFRGHSYSLDDSFPYDIFGNRPGNILFVPGSCGSASSTPKYIVTNPNTDFVFISNTSTGRGQVTNTLVDMLIDFAKTGREKIKFNDLIANNSKKIERFGTKTVTIKIYSLGEALLDYVFS